MTSTITLEDLESQARSIIQEVQGGPRTFQQESVGSAISELFGRTKEFFQGLADRNEEGIDILSEAAYKRFVKDHEYTQLYRLKTMVPEGFNDYYVRYVESLHQLQNFFDPLVNESLNNFEQYIGEFLNRPENLSSSRHSRLIQQFQDRDIEEQKQMIGQHFADDDAEFRSYGDVVENQKSWETIVPRFNELIERIQRVPLKDVSEAVQRVEDLLDALAKRIQDDREQYEMSDVSVKDLAALTTTVAQEVEFYATHRFMIQNLRTAFEYARIELPKRV